MNYTKEEIIKEVNNIVAEYGNFYIDDVENIDTYYIADSLKYSKGSELQVFSVINFIDENYIDCNIFLRDKIIEEDATYYYSELDIDILEKILKYCNSYKQQCIEN